MEPLPVHQHREAPDEQCARGINSRTRCTTEFLRDRNAEKVEESNLQSDQAAGLISGRPAVNPFEVQLQNGQSDPAPI